MNKTTSALLLFFVFALTLSSCGDGKDSIFELVSPSKSGISFNNEMKESRDVNLLNFAPIYNGAGVAVGDFNNDGLEDLFFTGNFVSSKLYINKGNLEFEDITESAGLETSVWCNGVSIVDINADGHNDIYISVSGADSTQRENLLYINNGDLTFTEQAKSYGLNDSGHSTHSAFLDYDLDGDLDVYVLTYGNNEGTDLTLVNKKVTDGTAISNDRLYRNNGDNTFTNVNEEAGILTEGYGLGIAVNDLNNDQYPDIYVSNDFLFDDIIYINNQDGTFSDQSKAYLRHTSHFGMGIDFQDFNNDLLPDVVQVDMMPEDNYRQKKILGPMQFDFYNLSIKEGYTPQYMRNSLQLNQGEKGFSEIGQLAGINETDWSWAPLFADYDANGEKDLIITNGFRRNVTDWDFRNYIREQLEVAKENGEDPDEVALEIVKKTNDLKLPNYAYAYNGDLTFQDVTTDWGLSEPSWSNGMIYADLDNDGDLDIVISNIDDVAHVYENTLDKKEVKNNYISIELKGNSNNPDGLGAKIIVSQNGRKQSHYQTKTRGYLSNVSSKIYFGFGQNNSEVNVEVIWPNGETEEKTSNTNSSVSFDIKNSAAPSKEATLITRTSGNQASAFGLDHETPENDYVDFYYEPLLPHRLSQAGPTITKGDVNGDGLDDLFVGGSSSNLSHLLIQNSTGQFDKKVFTDSDQFEDTDAIFLDIDLDGDLDLYVASGSNEFDANDPKYQDRIYINDGKGTFIRDEGSLPTMLTSTGTVAANDFDNDGDLDIFVGGRLSPKSYPMPGTSYLLRNDGGKFTDVTTDMSSGLSDAGMVTTSAWADIDGDGQEELVIAGEFMPIMVFKNIDGVFKDQTDALGLSNHTGWWNTILIDDVNKDGKLDILAGNLGENTKYQISIDEPLSVFAKDFDKNGMIDPIMSCFIGGKEHILHSKSTLETQVIGFKKRFIKHEPFAQATFEDIISEELREGAYTLKANTFKHTLFINNGDTFSAEALPKAVQIAPLKAIQKNGDRFYLSGNDYSTEVIVGQYDASHGFELHYSISDKKFVVEKQSSYRASGNIKDAVIINVGAKKVVVHTATGESLYVREVN
ncbi:VCBS repeat-containing protein [Roseivirga sp.]|uniref:VCBS repeat-containing protein n=1 Tax=Roseivirga sp. TaxID=1964215 RepID=UPI003B8E5156